MHPLLRRILIRGTFVAAATVGVALLFRHCLEVFLNLDGPSNVTPSTAFGMRGPIVFGLVGFALVALLEWLTDRRDQAKNKRA